jgi:hypothetical protein
VRQGGVTWVARRPPGALSRLAAASPPPALGVEREPLPPSRVGGRRALARARLHRPSPLGFTPSPVGHTGRSSSFGGIPLHSCSQPPTPRSGCWGRRLPGGALPRGRQRPSLKPNTLSTRSLERLAAGRHAPEPPTAPPRSRRALRPRAARFTAATPLRGGPAG